MVVFWIIIHKYILSYKKMNNVERNARLSVSTNLRKAAKNRIDTYVHYLGY